MLLRKITIGNETIPSYLFKDIKEAAVDIINISKCDAFVLIYDIKLYKYVDELYTAMNKQTTVVLLPLDIQEATKNFSTLSDLIGKLLAIEVNLNTCLVAIGGGVLGNTVGMSAGLLYRGIDFVHIPTTLMACADSTISLKQAVNFEGWKNIVGLYYLPKGVFTIYSIIQNLPPEEISAGYAEYVKNLITLIPEEIDDFMLNTFDRNYIKYEDLRNLIINSIAAKELVIKRDPKEKNEGIILEYGHTIGHALEVFSKGIIRHGEGVAIGMLVCAELSHNVFLMSDHDVEQHWKMLEHIGVFRSLKYKAQFLRNLKIDQVMECVFNDNKRGRIKCSNNEIPMVLLDTIGHIHIENDFFLYPIDCNLLANSLDVVISRILEIIK